MMKLGTKTASRFALNRRTLLRGALGGLALPALNAMFDSNGVAYADGTELPKRFGMWWWGVGVEQSRWKPSATGASYPLSEQLAPLGASDPSLRDYVSVLTGFNCRPDYNTLGHHAGWSFMTTGSGHTTNAGRPGDGRPINPSIDQVVAAKWKGLARSYDSIELGVSLRGAGKNPDYCVACSQKNQDQVNAPIADPLKLYNLLFPNGAGGVSVDPAVAKIAALKSSILDGYLAEAQTLKLRKLGADDGRRLDDYMENVRAIEKRIADSATGATSACAVPAAPAAQGDGLEHEEIVQRGRLLYDLMALGLACDATRVFSVVWSPMQATTLFWPVTQNNRGDDYHEQTHSNFGFVNPVVKFMIGELAYFLAALKSKQEGAGNLLDSLCMYGSSEVSEGGNHSTDNMPLLVVGKAGGGLKSGQHVAKNGVNANDAFLTMFRALGLGMDSFGYEDAARTSSVVSELLV